MGVDAQMLVRTQAEMSEARVRDLAYDIAAHFGHKCFLINRERGLRALSIVEKYEQDGPSIKPEPGETFIEVHLLGRYYGVGYERGDLPLYIMIAEWLERRIPRSVIWYGGDSSGILAVRFDRRARDHLFGFFCEVGHFPYTDGWWGDHQPPRSCDFCERRMIQHGSGRKFAAFNCPGCGHVEETRDGGLTWKQPGEGRKASG